MYLFIWLYFILPHPVTPKLIPDYIHIHVTINIGAIPSVAKILLPVPT